MTFLCKSTKLLLCILSRYENKQSRNDSRDQRVRNATNKIGTHQKNNNSRTLMQHRTPLSVNNPVIQRSEFNPSLYLQVRSYIEHHMTYSESVRDQIVKLETSFEIGGPDLDQCEILIFVYGNLIEAVNEEESNLNYHRKRLHELAVNYLIQNNQDDIRDSLYKIEEIQEYHNWLISHSNE